MHPPPVGADVGSTENSHSTPSAVPSTAPTVAAAIVDAKCDHGVAVVVDAVVADGYVQCHCETVVAVPELVVLAGASVLVSVSCV